MTEGDGSRFPGAWRRGARQGPTVCRLVGQGVSDGVRVCATRRVPELLQAFLTQAQNQTGKPGTPRTLAHVPQTQDRMAHPADLAWQHFPGQDPPLQPPWALLSCRPGTSVLKSLLSAKPAPGNTHL